MTTTGLTHSDDLEREALGAYLMDPGVCEEMERLLGPEDFTKPCHRALWIAAKEIRQREGFVDMVLVHEYAGTNLTPLGGAAYLANLPSACAAPSEGPSRARKLREYTRRREFAIGAHQLVELATDRTATMAAIRQHIDRLSALALTPDAGSTGMRPIGELMDEERMRAQDRANGRATDDVIATGWRELDTLLRGGIRRSDLVIVGGRPAMGKSAVALQMLLNTARAGRGAVLFSLEMTAGQQAQRALASIAGVPLGVIREGASLTAPDVDQLDRAVDEGGRLRLWVDDRPTVTLAYLRGEVRRLKRVCPDLAVVAVDYLQLLTGQRSFASDTRASEVGALSAGLKALAKDESVAVLALAQLNRNLESRGVDDRRPMPSDLKESGSLEQDADIILFPYRHAVYVPDDPTLADQMEIIVAKHRGGEIGTARVRWTGDLQRVEDLSTTPSQGGAAVSGPLATVADIRQQVGRLFAAYNVPSSTDATNYVRHLTGVQYARLVLAVDQLCQRRVGTKVPPPVMVGQVAQTVRAR